MNSTIMLIIVLVYFLGLLFIAHYTSKNSDNQSFFIGNKKSKWWVVAFGMIGTSLSGMTFISVPGTVGNVGFSYFQVVIGYWIGYFIVAFVLLPIYYKMNLTSIYTYLEKRLGVNAHKTGAVFFILSRTVGATLRLYLVIKVLEIFILKDLGISFEITAIVIMILILLYTYRGGVKTIVWTDTLQTTFMLLALVISLVYVSNLMDFSLFESWKVATNEGLTQTFNLNVNEGGFFLKQIIGGMFITIAMTGLDQEMMQKNISVSNLKDSQKNMSVMGTLQMVVVFIFLFLGSILTLYAQSQGMAITAGDDLFPTIALKSGLPFFISICFIIGLISALFPSADGALTALTSSFCIDILGLNPKDPEKEKQKKITKTRLTVHSIFALIFLLFIFFFREIDNGSLIDILLKLAGFTYGPLLGLFAFGILTKRVTKGYKPLIVSLISLVLTLILDMVNNYTWYQDKLGWDESTRTYMAQICKSLFSDYKIGVELILINGLLTFIGLWIVSKRKSEN